ncbi:MAG: septum formation inhibitor Maf [Eubacterium sp.]|nr:septum formation inhibitor Maf [Eubacterium sp.]
MNKRTGNEKSLPRLSARLKLVSEMIPPCKVLADIGCDHGYTAITAFLTGKADKCIAMDVNAGPLAAAQENTARFAASEGVEIRLSDGFGALLPQEADVIVIAGLGGRLMLSMLEAGMPKLKRNTVLVLSPQSEPELVRTFLAGEGFLLYDEAYVEDEGKVYSVLAAERADGNCDTPVQYTDAELAFGPAAIRRKDPVLKEVLARQLAQTRELLDRLAGNSREKAGIRKEELAEREKLLMEALDLMEKEKIILASASPRRKQLLETAGFHIEVVVSSADEHIPGCPPAEMVEKLSYLKCADVAEKTEDGIILGADTVVAFEGEILGKPKDAEDAARMLSMLSGQTHQVYTGVTVIRKEKGKICDCETFHAKTDVTVAELTEEEIKAYIASGEPFDKAGSYGIQGLFSRHVTGIKGDYTNVVGLPVPSVYSCLKRMKNAPAGI